jgi:hypothetical protein
MAQALVMRKIELYAIDHISRQKRIRPIFGGISKCFICGLDDLEGIGISTFETYADMRAPYWIWKNRDDLDIIGFHGYRKFLDFRNILKAPGWFDVGIGDFRAYQDWLTQSDGVYIQWLLSQYDIIVTSPFDCSYNGNIAEDFRISRSYADWKIFEDVMPYTAGEYYRTRHIYPMHFVTRASVFNRFMEWWWPRAEEIRSRIKSIDTYDPAYRVRPMAYISERIFSMWLDHSGLSTVEVPLLICWNAK